MTHDNKKPIHHNEAANLAQDKSKALVIEIVSFDPISGVKHTSRSRGKIARSLLFLYYVQPYGITRMESLRRWNILCLTQHVSSLRQNHKLDIETQRIRAESVDGIANVGRYHLVSNVRLYLVGGAS